MRACGKAVYKEIVRPGINALQIEIHPDAKSCGGITAKATAKALIECAENRRRVAMIFASRASQLDRLDALVNYRDIPWSKISGFHSDEYTGIGKDSPALFRRSLHENLTIRVTLHDFSERDGDAQDLDAICASYASRLRETDSQLCLLVLHPGTYARNDAGARLPQPTGKCMRSSRE